MQMRPAKIVFVLPFIYLWQAKSDWKGKGAAVLFSIQLILFAESCYCSQLSAYLPAKWGFKHQSTNLYSGGQSLWNHQTFQQLCWFLLCFKPYPALPDSHSSL